jgi:hypothetical protein
MTLQLVFRGARLTIAEAFAMRHRQCATDPSEVLPTPCLQRMRKHLRNRHIDAIATVWSHSFPRELAGSDEINTTAVPFGYSS